MVRIEYFELIAQIGPVLMLAYVIEARVSNGIDARLPRWIGAVFSAAAVAQGLRVAAGIEPPTRTAAFWASACLLAGLLYLPLSLDPPLVKSTTVAWLILVSPLALTAFMMLGVAGLM